MKKYDYSRMCLTLLAVVCLLFFSPAHSLADTKIEGYDVPQRSGIMDIFSSDMLEGLTGDSQAREKKEITVMVYMCGSDLESEYGAATNDISEIACSGFDPDKVQVLVLTGGSRQWFIPGLPSNKNNVWDVRPDILFQLYEQKQPTSWEEFAPLLRQSLISAVSDASSSMGAPQTLTEFLDFVHTNYPSEKYALVLWDHGGGPNNGVCVDRLFDNDFVSVTELKNSLETSSFRDEKLEWIGFDACLMASAEVAMQIAPYAKYMVCSEETEPGCGWNYEFLETIDQDEDGLATCKRIIDCYSEALREIEKANDNKIQFTATLSCIDLEKMDQVRDACDSVFSALNSNLTEDNYVELAKERKESAGFGRAESPNALDFDLVDLGDFAARVSLGDEAAQKALIDAIQDAVVYNKTNMNGATGLTIYFPYYSARAFSYFEPEYQQISFSEPYYDFMKHFNEIQTGQAQANYSGISTGMPALGHKDVRTLLSVTLTAEQMNALSEAHLLVFEKDEAKDAYALVSYVPETTRDETTLTAEYVHRALFITDIDGNAISPALPYTALEDGRYAVEATLIRDDEAGNEVFRKKVLLYLTMNDKNGAVTIGNIFGYDEYTGSYLPRYSLNLEDFDRVEFVRSLRAPKEFGEGTLCAWEEWEEKEQEIYSLNLKDEHLMMLHNQIPLEKLNAGFLLCDYQNNWYISALLSLDDSPVIEEFKLRYDDEDTALITGGAFKVRENGAKSKGNLTMEVKNLTAQEVAFVLRNLKINGDDTDLTTEVYGTGAHEGLNADESQILMLPIPSDVLSKYDAITSITFDLVAENVETRESIKVIPVTVTLNQDLSFMK